MFLHFRVHVFFTTFYVHVYCQTTLYKVGGCGTSAPIWLQPPKEGLPLPEQEAIGQACITWSIAGQEQQCCAHKWPINIVNCVTYFVYKLRRPPGCPLAYCAQRK